MKLAGRFASGVDSPSIVSWREKGGENVRGRCTTYDPLASEIMEITRPVWSLRCTDTLPIARRWCRVARGFTSPYASVNQPRRGGSRYPPGLSRSWKTLVVERTTYVRERKQSTHDHKSIFLEETTSDSSSINETSTPIESPCNCKSFSEL